MSTALIVEDDPSIQIVTKAILTKLGCNVEIAGMGNEGLEKAQAIATIDICFIDIGLPDILGYDVIKGIREIRGKEVPIIAITGYTGAEQKAKCLEAGASEVLHKPVLKEGFREVLLKYKII